MVFSQNSLTMGLFSLNQIFISFLVATLILKFYFPPALLRTEMLFSKIYLFNAFHKPVEPSDSTRRLDPPASGNANPIWLGQEFALFSVRHMRAGSPRRRLLGKRVGTWHWLGPSYALSLSHSDWFWAGGVRAQDSNTACQNHL